MNKLIRVAVAAGVGYLVALLAKQGFHVSPVWTGVAVTAITGVVAGVYLKLVETLEKRWPWLGHLLGVKAQPEPAPRPVRK